MKSIIVEGYDGCGKSTLARQLGDYYQIGVHSIGGPPRDNGSADRMSLLQLDIITHSCAIFDRITSLSRLCYEENLTENHSGSLMEDFHFAVKKCIVVWVDTINPIHILKDTDSKQHIESIGKRRHDIMREYSFHMDCVSHIKYDYTKSDFQQLCSLIDKENER